MDEQIFLEYRWTASRSGEFSLSYSRPDEFVMPVFPDIISDGGTVVSVENIATGTLVLVRVIDRECQIHDDGMAVMTGTPRYINFMVSYNTLLLLHDNFLGEGATVVGYYSSIAPVDSIHPPQPHALVLRSLDYPWIHVGSFDDNFMSLCGGFSLAIFEDAEITFINGFPFQGELNELANRPLAVYVDMSASPTPDGPLVHGIGSSRIMSASPTPDGPLVHGIGSSRIIVLDNTTQLPQRTFDPTIVQIDRADRIYLPAWETFHKIDYNLARGNIFDDLITPERLEQGIGGDTLVIWFDNPVTDFMLIGLYHGSTENGDMQTSVSEFLYAIPELHPDKPIMLTSYFGVGTFPQSGIAFTDHDGNRRHFFIIQDQSGYGDPYRLIEFEPWSC